MLQIIKKIHRIIYPILTVFFLLVLDRVFHVEPDWVRIAVAIALGYFLSPRKKIIQTESGEKKQLTWIFFKKPIFLD
ncbi:hypothetical protein CXF68_04735 [Tenacibaculum sp. Bg11-29]|uniref:hypothetical protein n=1 Tax=Tenacibaculum sp. Bg11-29 TaxID=2058306 RepID=UPI000C336964|nr:hypothetical protein [Tenacibaculum sp. Bg11-29]PKH50053.1 hypothetical protein CXF68_04735 [Tenacibaculum sp. Bg11-29]